MKRKDSHRPTRQPNFPLFAHGSGQWAKKIKGRVYYFGTWEDPQGALNKYLDEREYLIAGRVPPTQATTLADLLNHFLSDKQRSLEAGDIVPRTYDEYVAVCDKIAILGKQRSLESFGREDFSHLRALLGKGGRLAPSTVKRFTTMARSVFGFATEELGFSLRYKRALKPPSAKQLRRANNVERLYTAEQVRALLAADGQLRAMILLAINCGFGNRDCALLPIERIKNGWHTYPRPKTEIARRCPLWPETVEALAEVIGDRTEGLVFRTRRGNAWVASGSGDPISAEFRKLVVGLGFYRAGVTTFYTLRRTFETIATASGVPQAAIDAIQGHAPHTSDMGAVYRQKVFDDQLRQCVEYVRGWVEGSITLD